MMYKSPLYVPSVPLNASLFKLTHVYCSTSPWRMLMPSCITSATFAVHPSLSMLLPKPKRSLYLAVRRLLLHLWLELTCSCIVV